MQQAKFTADIVRFVEAQGSATFAEIENLLAQKGMTVRGKKAICVPGHRHLVVWSGMSPEFLTEIQALGKAPVELEPGEYAEYLPAGSRTPNLPIAWTPNTVPANCRFWVITRITPVTTTLRSRIAAGFSKLTNRKEH